MKRRCVYLAARLSRRDELLTYATDLNARGHVVTARWVTHNKDDESTTTVEYQSAQARQWAIEDLEDVRASDLFVHFTDPRGSRQRGGGRFVEHGYALALGIAPHE